MFDSSDYIRDGTQSELSGLSSEDAANRPVTSTPPVEDPPAPTTISSADIPNIIRPNPSPVVESSGRVSFDTEKVQKVVDETIAEQEAKWRSSELPNLEAKIQSIYAERGHMLINNKMELRDLNNNRIPKLISDSAQSSSDNLNVLRSLLRLIGLSRRRLFLIIMCIGRFIFVIIIIFF